MEETKSPKTITENECLQVKGLLLLAKEHDGQLQLIERAVERIVGGDGRGHVSDAVFANHNLEDLLRGMEITVEDVDGGE